MTSKSKRTAFYAAGLIAAVPVSYVTAGFCRAKAYDMSSGFVDRMHNVGDQACQSEPQSLTCHMLGRK